ncbi:MAG: hypothetical protein J5814_10385 [Bacteroidaceae bacterium]|nr:hypothetical protein [Bacteroidaceae bacterium]
MVRIHPPQLCGAACKAAFFMGAADAIMSAADAIMGAPDTIIGADDNIMGAADAAFLTAS